MSNAATRDERNKKRQVALPFDVICCGVICRYAEKLLPQPQLLTALGLLNVNPRLSRPE